MAKKKNKSELKFTYYNPNTSDKMRALLKNIIMKILLDKKINQFIDYPDDDSQFN